jgi:hypothetical protein
LWPRRPRRPAPPAGTEPCCGGHSGPLDVARHAGWVLAKNILGLVAFGVFLGIAGI